MVSRTHDGRRSRIRNAWDRSTRAMLRLPLAGKLAGANGLVLLAVVVACATRSPLPLQWSELWAIGVALALATVLNALLVAVALRPVRDLERTARAVIGGRLDARVPASPVADGRLERIGITVNGLLDRLTADRARTRLLAAEVIYVADRDRAALALQLHDSIAQSLAALTWALAAAEQQRQEGIEPTTLPELRDLAHEVLEEVRLLSHTVHPRVLDDLGLAAGLKRLARRMGEESAATITVRVIEGTGAEAPALPRGLASVLYRVAEEAVRNALRHSRASRIEVALRVDATAATVEITDDGQGFDAAAGGELPGAGLFMMRERVALVDGDFSVTSAAGRGTKVVARVRLDGALDADASTREAIRLAQSSEGDAWQAT